MTACPANNASVGPITRKAAGRISKQLLKYEEGTSEYLEAFRDAQRWRAQHAVPTENCFRSLLSTAESFPTAVISFRLKRMKSMLAKIRRTDSHYQIGTMDDIGGCRMVLDDINQVQNAIEVLRETFTLKQGNNSIKNYIETPRASGYRSCHLISVNPGTDRDYRVEIQVRTGLQHLWSTAVEAASIVYETDFKADRDLRYIDQQEHEIRSFFAITSSLFALEEGMPQVKGHVGDLPQLRHELKRLQQLERIIEELATAEDGVYLSDSGTMFDQAGFYLMRFATDQQFLDIGYYSEDALEDALSAYNEYESLSNAVGRTANPIDYDDIVLTYAQGREQLDLAFPNYSTRMKAFLDHVSQYL